MGFRYHSLELGPEGLSELDGSRRTVHIPRSEIREVTVTRGRLAERPMAQAVASAACFIFGLYVALAIGGLLIGVSLFLFFLAGYGLWSGLRQGLFLCVTTRTGSRKLLLTGGGDEPGLRRYAEDLALSLHPDREVAPAISTQVASPEQCERVMAAVQAADAWKQLGNLDEALGLYDDAIQANPQSVVALFSRGVAYCMQERNGRAIRDLSRCIELAPWLAGAYCERGLAHAQNGAPERARTDYNAALAIDPAYIPAYLNRADLLCRQKEYEQAESDVTWAVRLDNLNPVHYWNRACLRSQRGQVMAALVDLDACLRCGPEAELAQRAEHLRHDLCRQAGLAAPPSWSPVAELWTQVVALPADTTVAELVRVVNERGPFFVVFLEAGALQLAHVDGADGIRRRLYDIADQIGDAVLALRLGQLHDLWTPCLSITPELQHDQASVRSLVAVVVNGEVQGVLVPPPERPEQRLREEFLFQAAEREDSAQKPGHDRLDPPTILFGAWQRFARDSAARACTGCQKMFAYYRPSFADGMLADYLCPHCGREATTDWIAARMRPGAWSTEGFLDPQEDLATIMAIDAQTLVGLGVTYAQLADALDRLLEPAIDDWERDPLRHFGIELDELTSELRRGMLPSPEQGFRLGEHQVFFHVLPGYQDCPWTALYRPFSDDRLGVPSRFYGGTEDEIPEYLCRSLGLDEQAQRTTAVMATVTGRRRRCRGSTTYRGADREFLLINRRTQEYLRGPAMITHLIRDHHFFEGKHGRYRVEPEQAARILELVRS